MFAIFKLYSLATLINPGKNPDISPSSINLNPNPLGSPYFLVSKMSGITCLEYIFCKANMSDKINPASINFNCASVSKFNSLDLLALAYLGSLNTYLCISS